MAARDRVLTALNFLAGEGIDYYPSGCNDNAIEALINDGSNDTSDDESDHSDDQGYFLLI